MTEASTITRPVSVNDAFAAERQAMVGRIENLRSEEGQAAYIAEQTANFDARVTAGELVKLGEGRYQSTQGWDKGEIWTVRSVNGQQLVLPEHGLDLMEGGKAKLYSAVPAWHGLGQVIPGGISDVEDVIRLGGLDVPALSIPVAPYKVPGLPGTFEAPGKFHVVNGLTGKHWGIVGKIHKNIPVRVSFEFIQNLINDKHVIWDSAGLMNDGATVFICCKVPAGITIDPEGINEQEELFVVIQDTRDGSGSYMAMVTPWRPLCGNTNRFALRDAVSKISLRHTSGLPAAIQKARATLGMTVTYADVFAAEETALARTNITIADFEREMAELFAEGNNTPSGQVFKGRQRGEEGKRTELANNRREDDLMERLGIETARVGRTAYAAEQAYTGHLDWGKTRKGTTPADRWLGRVEANLGGDDDGLKTKAHAKLLQLVGGGTERR